MVGKLQPEINGKPRCQARTATGGTSVYGRLQCSNYAKDGEAFCSTHLKQHARKHKLRSWTGRAPTEEASS